MKILALFILLLTVFNSNTIQKALTVKNEAKNLSNAQLKSTNEKNQMPILHELEV